MKLICLALLSIGLLAPLSQAETFLGPTTPANRLLVATNSAIIITATLGDFTNSTQVQFDGGGPFTQTDFAPLQSGTVYAVAGPAELVFSNAALFTFYRLTNSTIRSQTIANDPIGISIPTNQTMRLFAVPAPVNASFSRLDSAGDGSVSFVIEPNRPAEFSGPGTLFLNSGVLPPHIKFISYVMTPDGAFQPGCLGPGRASGNLFLSIEKSKDLNAWSPVWSQGVWDPGSTFYRLRLQR